MKKIQKVILLSFIIAFFGVMARSVFITINELRENEAKISQLKDYLYRLREENIRLKKEVYRLKYDKDYIELLVREELGWTKPGEILCIPIQNR